MENKMNKLTALAIATIAILAAFFLGWCIAIYADSYAAFKGAIG